MTDPMTDFMTDMMTDTGVTAITAYIEAMMTDHMTDTATDTDTMMGDKEHILVEGKHWIFHSNFNLSKTSQRDLHLDCRA